MSNLLAAMAISGAAGATVEAMAEVARSFTGVPHRLEIVGESGGVTWINDSIATSPERAVAGLRSFGRGGGSLILLAGGKDKNLPWDEFAAEVVERVDFLIGFGQAGPMIVEKVQDYARFAHHRAPSSAITQRLDEAVELAARAAESGLGRAALTRRHELRRLQGLRGARRTLPPPCAAEWERVSDGRQRERQR